MGKKIPPLAKGKMVPTEPWIGELFGVRDWFSGPQAPHTRPGVKIKPVPMPTRKPDTSRIDRRVRQFQYRVRNRPPTDRSQSHPADVSMRNYDGRYG